MGGRLSGPKKIIMKSHVNWGHVSAQKLKRVPVDSNGSNMHLVTLVGEVSDQCKVCRASDESPHVPSA